jgi:ribosome-binding factor A
MPTNNHRNERVADLVLATLSRLLITEMRDPGLTQVVLTRATLTRDLQLARIYYTFQGKANPTLAAKGLQRAEGFLRHEVAKRLDLRRVPKLEFLYDEALAYGRKIEDLMREIKTSYPPSSEPEPPPPSAPKEPTEEK